MKYPKLSCEASRRSKFCEKDKAKVKKLHKKGLNQREISEKLNMSQTTVRYVLDKKVRERGLKQSRDINRKRYKSDPEFYKKIKEAVRINYKKRYHSDPEFRKYMSEVGKKYYKEHKVHIRKRSKKWLAKILADPVKRKKYKKKQSEQRKKAWANLSPAKKKRRIRISNMWHKDAYKDPIKRAKLKEANRRYRKKNAKIYKKYYKLLWAKTKANPKLMAKARKQNKISVKKYQEKKRKMKQ